MRWSSPSYSATVCKQISHFNLKKIYFLCIIPTQNLDKSVRSWCNNIIQQYQSVRKRGCISVNIYKTYRAVSLLGRKKTLFKLPAGAACLGEAQECAHSGFVPPTSPACLSAVLRRFNERYCWKTSVRPWKPPELLLTERSERAALIQLWVYRLQEDVLRIL